MNKTSRVVIIHGTYGSPDANWFPWLKNEIDSLGACATVPKFPTPERQNLSNWKKAFHEQVEALDENTILVGHSLGAGFILDLLEDPNSVPIKGTFLIAGFLGKIGLPDYDQLNETFLYKDFDWNTIKRNAGHLSVISGDDDPYVPRGNAEELAKSLTTPLELIPNGGHLNAERGFTSFELLKNKVQLLL